MIVFLGDSFTYGQGMYLYKLVETGKYDISKPEDYLPPKLIYEKLSLRDIEYQNKYSFPGIVSKHYNKQSFKRHRNGGSNYDIIMLLRNLHLVVDPHAIDCIFVQPTDPLRFDSMPEHHEYHHKIVDNIKNKSMSEYDGYMELANLQYINMESHLQYLEKLGKPYYYLPWPTWWKTIIPKEKMIPVQYKNKIYWTMEDLMRKDNMQITNDIEFCLDMHISRDAHKVIADSIIKCFPTGDFSKKENIELSLPQNIKFL